VSNTQPTPDLAGVLSKLAEPAAYTIPQFCEAHHISLPTYYKFKNAGMAPAEMRIGAVVRISREAAAEWRLARTNPTGDEAAAVARSTEKQRERAVRASTSAVASPNHVSRTRTAV
jgi:hypothetical protein